MDIPVCIVKQKLKIAMNHRTIISGTKEFVRFSFWIPDDWDGLGLFAQFKQNNKIYRKALDKENSVYFPEEIGAGSCTLTIVGIDCNKDIIGLTDTVVLTIKDNNLDGEFNGDQNDNAMKLSGAILVTTDNGYGDVTMVVL